MNYNIPAPFPGRQSAFIAAQDVDELAFLGMKRLPEKVIHSYLMP
jgi:hypothetical protein